MSPQQKWCEYHKDYVDPKETEVFSGVDVHKDPPWHILLTGEVIEMKEPSVPDLEGGLVRVRLEEPRMVEAEAPTHD